MPLASHSNIQPRTENRKHSKKTAFAWNLPNLGGYFPLVSVMLYNVNQNVPISGAIWFGIGNTVGILNVDAVFGAVWAVRHTDHWVRTRREGSHIPSIF